MNCPPCNTGDHDNCTPGISAVSLGMKDECNCYRYADVHFVPAKVALPSRTSWAGDERRDREHDTGEDEFDTWIARNAMEMED